MFRQPGTGVVPVGSPAYVMTEVDSKFKVKANPDGPGGPIAPAPATSISTSTGFRRRRYFGSENAEMFLALAVSDSRCDAACAFVQLRTYGCVLKKTGYVQPLRDMYSGAIGSNRQHQRNVNPPGCIPILSLRTTLHKCSCMCFKTWYRAQRERGVSDVR